MPSPERPNRKRRAEMGLAGMGFDLAASVGVATALGWWIDRRFDTAPWGVVICGAIGIIGGLYNFVKAGIRAQQSAERDKSDD